MDVQTCENDLLALKEKGLALRDAIDLLSGKWKFCIMLNLCNMDPCVLRIC
jgi:DNA-binding HxlR family transcriptional regulator